MRVRYTLAVLLVAASCSSGTGSGAPGAGGTGGSAGQAHAGSGGTGNTGGATAGSGGAGSTGGAIAGSGGAGSTGGAIAGSGGNAATAGSGGAGNAGGATAGSGGTGNAGGATAGSGGMGNTGGATAGSGGACPAELPPTGNTGFIPYSTPGYESCCTGVAFGLPCTTKNLLCAVQQQTATGCPGIFQYKCDGAVFMPTLAHSDPPLTCTGTAGTGGRGGTGGSGGGAGMGGGVAGQGGSGGAAGAQLIGPPRSTAPWDASCVAGSLDRPAGPTYLTGPYAGSGLGSTPLPGESVIATFNGLARAFSISLTVGENASGSISIRAYGNDGFMTLSVPTGGPGSYTCPVGDSYVSYANLKAGWEGNAFGSNTGCCKFEITKVGAVGEAVEGTFSGILNSQINTWVQVEAGAFRVIRRAPATSN